MGIRKARQNFTLPPRTSPVQPSTPGLPQIDRRRIDLAAEKARQRKEMAEVWDERDR